MFNHTAYSDFFGKHKKTLQRLDKMRGHMEARFHEAEAPVNAVLLAALADLPCLLVGAPGVAKSRLIRTFCEMIGVIDPKAADDGDTPEERRYFEYLLTAFTEPTELFGAFRLERMEDGKQVLNRVETGMLHKCDVAFLDEVFRGSSAILNTLLALMNERRFHDRGEVKRSELKLLFGASNDLVRSDDLAALRDRFVLRAHMANADPSAMGLGALIDRAGQAHKPIAAKERYPTFLTDTTALREDFLKREASDDPVRKLFDFDSDEGRDFLANLGYLIRLCRTKGLGDFSNRRVFQLVRIVAMQRLLRAGREGVMGDTTLTLDDYAVIWTHLLDVAEPVKGDTLSMLQTLPHMPPIGQQTGDGAL